MIYIGAMIGSVLISSVAALASRLAVRGYERFDLLMEHALTILKAGREAGDAPTLLRLELEIDEILTQSLARRRETGRPPDCCADLGDTASAACYRRPSRRSCAKRNPNQA